MEKFIPVVVIKELSETDKILTALDNAKSEIEEYKGNRMADINIAVDSASLLIPDIVRSIRESYPKIMPHIFQDLYADWDIRLYSDSKQDKNSILLTEERIGIVAHREHPLCQKENLYSNDLYKYNFIGLGENHNLHKITAELCEKYSFEPNIIMSADSPAMLREFVKMNLGIAFIPEITWKRFINDGLIFKTVEDMPMMRCVQLQLNSKKHLTQAARCCKIVITEYFEEYNRMHR